MLILFTVLECNSRKCCQLNEALFKSVRPFFASVRDYRTTREVQHISTAQKTLKNYLFIEAKVLKIYMMKHR